MTNIEPTDEELKTIQIFPASVLLAAAHKKLDLNRLARQELANRGLDMSGKWVGFAQAEKIHR